MTGPRFVTAIIDRRLFAVRWIRFRVPDLGAVREQIRSTREREDAPVIYLSLIPASNRVFSQQEHVMLGAYVRDLLSDCASIHHVLEGEGFVASARRSIVTQLAMGTPRPDAFFTHATLEEAAATIAPRLRTSALALVEEARGNDIAFPATRVTS